MKSSRVPLYLETHPDSHYMPIGSVDGVWVGESRNSASRQLVMVKELRKISISDIDYLVKVTHVGITRTIALYHWHGILYWAHEWVDLDLFEILPLRDDEMCNIMEQIILVVQYLRRMFIGFRFESIRVNADGAVKVVLDWNYEPKVGLPEFEAEEGYIATFLQETMFALSVGMSEWSSQARNILFQLRAGSLLDISVSRLPQSHRTREAAQLSMRRKAIRGGSR